MDDSKVVLQLHEELLKTNRDFKYFKDDCKHKFNKQKRVNRFLICCLISLVAKKAITNIKNVNEKGTADTK